jgi:hypothetical protein|tara:strand:+ start:371 stop:958 length:588 start_codon:yes stop_codon:yes gene_type:complete
MRKHIVFSILIVVALLSFGMSDSKEKGQTLPTIEQMEEEKRLREEAIKDSIANYHKVELDNFLSAIGFRESGNRYDITNTFGYMGKYQFGRATLKGLGYKVSKKEFLNNPDLQEEAMLSLLNHNKEKLQTYIDVYDGKTINGIYITESGILAAAHLGGQGSVRRYFRNGKVFKDGYGTKITSYMSNFSGYDINLN